MKLLVLILAFGLTGIAHADDDDIMFEDDSGATMQEDYDSSTEMETMPDAGEEMVVNEPETPAKAAPAATKNKANATTTGKTAAAKKRAHVAAKKKLAKKKSSKGNKYKKKKKLKKPNNG